MPRYVYELPCGGVYYSQTPSVPTEYWAPPFRKATLGAFNTLVGVHYFPCLRCDDTHAVLDSALKVRVPRDSISRRIGDSRTASRVDDAIRRDRAVSLLNASEMTCEEIAKEVGLSICTVWTISQEIGAIRDEAVSLDDMEYVEEA